MRVKHLDELYTWKQIRKLQLVHDFNHHNGFVPIALYAPGAGYTSHYGGTEDWYGWYGNQTAYCAKILWEKVRLELADLERDALAFDIVPASECFNTIRFKNPDKARSYRDIFMEKLREFADGGKLKSAIGRVPARPYPWDTSKRYEEVIISDDAAYRPGISHESRYDNTIPDYVQSEFPGWIAVEPYFIELAEDELAFLGEEKIINRKPTAKDKELAEACYAHDVEKVARLLDSGANPNSFVDDPLDDGLLAYTFLAIVDHEDVDSAIKNALKIAELLLSHGCDIDLCPFDGPTPLFDSINHDISFTKFLLEKGADPNAVSWIAFYDDPATPLDHVSDDISAYGKEPYLMETLEMLEARGGKYFSELVPDFYES